MTTRIFFTQDPHSAGLAQPAFLLIAALAGAGLSVYATLSFAMMLLKTGALG
jgi:hypothetical protein